MNEFKIIPGINTYNLPVEGIRINFLLDNKQNEELVVFLHGLACTKESFRFVLNNPLFSGVSLLLIDLPGFGESSKSLEFSYGMDEQAMICEELINRLPFKCYHVAAHSMGGAVGLLFSKEFFKKVKSFSNLEGNLIGEDCEMFSKIVAGVSEDEYISELYAEQKKELEKFEILKFDKTTPSIIHKSSASLVQWSESGELLDKFGSLKVRKAYFYGEENLGMKILEKLDFCQKIMIPDAGHSMMIENPGVFYKKLANFIFSA